MWQKNMRLACHYLRLAASITAGRRRLDVELDTIVSDPLPAEVIENMPRCADIFALLSSSIIPWGGIYGARR